MAENKFEMVLHAASQLPMVKINRGEFLRKELRHYTTPSAVELAVAHSPATARIPADVIDTIAKNCINHETHQVSAISFAAGLPGGLAMFGTVPADLAQFTAHQLRIAQKLAYLYGWDELFDEDGMDDGTQSVMTLFFGVMFGINGAANAVTSVAKQMAATAVKKLPQKALTKGTIYPIVKQIAKLLGQKMTKQIFANGVGKLIPVVGGAVSGGVTYVMFRPAANRLKRHLEALPLATQPHERSAVKEVDFTVVENT